MVIREKKDDMTFEDVKFLARSLCGLGPFLALGTVGYVWCSGFLSLLVIAAPSQNGFLGFINFVVYFTWLPLVMTSYFRSLLLGPGFVPFKWSPKCDSDCQFLQFCTFCDGYKPPRAHHCRRCNRCCMKMDHHCIWLGKCVGFRNQASFLTFLFGAVFGALHATCMIVRFSYVQLWIRLSIEPNIVLAVMVGSGFGLGTVIAVGMLLISQIKIALRNETSIESWIIEKANWRRKEVLKTNQAYQFPYDFGSWRVNLSKIMDNGDGMHFETIEGTNIYSLTIEQKLQKALKKEKAIAFKCVKPYSGWKCPIIQYPKFCLTPPIFDSTMVLTPGDEFIVTRGRKNWFYGYKPDKPKVRGFVPKSALEELKKEE